jgi:hypothetical protein
LAAHGLHAFLAAQGLHGLQAFFAAQGLQARFAAHGLQARFGAQAASAAGRLAAAVKVAIPAAVSKRFSMSQSPKWMFFRIPTCARSSLKTNQLTITTD